MPVNRTPDWPNAEHARQHAVMQGTIASVSPRAKELVAHFYGRLFGRAPEIEGRFAEVTAQQQHAKIWSVINLMANTESDGTKYQQRFAQLQAEHAERDLQHEHYRVFGEVLVESLRYFEGPRWNEEKQEAWTAAIEIAIDNISTAIAGESAAA